MFRKMPMLPPLRVAIFTPRDNQKSQLDFTDNITANVQSQILYAHTIDTHPRMERAPTLID